MVPHDPEQRPDDGAPGGLHWWLLFWIPGVTALLGLLVLSAWLVSQLGPGTGTGTNLFPADLILLTMPFLAAPVIGWLRVPFIMGRPSRGVPWLDTTLATIGVLAFGALTTAAIADPPAASAALVGMLALALQVAAIVQLIRAHRRRSS